MKKRQAKKTSSKNTPIRNKQIEDIKKEYAIIEEHRNIQNEQDESKIQNGLENVLFPNSYAGVGNQISSVDTLFVNLRWYLVSNLRQLLSQLYVENGLIEAIVDQPVEDAVRGGIDISTSDLDTDEIELLKSHMAENNDLQTIAQAAKWSRLYGGGGILIMTSQESDKPLDVDSLFEKEVKLRAVDMWELYHGKMNLEDDDVEMSTSLNFDEKVEIYNYYSHRVHNSRVLKIKGKEAPSFVRQRLRGWGLSVVEKFVRSLNQYLKSTDLAFEVLDEFKLDIFKINNLAQALQTKDGEALARKRVDLANREKNYRNAMVMDKEDDYMSKQLSFSGLAETMEGIRQQIASDLRMPMTKLFGISSAGFNSGEDDIENYNAMVENEVRDKIKHHVQKVVNIRCMQLFGKMPEDLKIEFEPLRILSTEQLENVKTQRFNRIMQARQLSEISAGEFRDAVNKDQLLEIDLEDDEQLLKELKDEKDSKIDAGFEPITPEV